MIRIIRNCDKCNKEDSINALNGLCPSCNLNPNDSQTETQRKWELEYIKTNKKCCSCIQEDRDLND